MRAKTKMLKEMMMIDIKRMHQHNNSKADKRTAEQNAQSAKDRRDFFVLKWETIRKTAETEAQKRYCDAAILAASSIR